MKSIDTEHGFSRAELDMVSARLQEKGGFTP